MIRLTRTNHERRIIGGRAISMMNDGALWKRSSKCELGTHAMDVNPRLSLALPQQAIPLNDRLGFTTGPPIARILATHSFTSGVTEQTAARSCPSTSKAVQHHSDYPSALAAALDVTMVVAAGNIADDYQASVSDTDDIQAFHTSILTKSGIRRNESCDVRTFCRDYSAAGEQPYIVAGTANGVSLMFQGLTASTGVMASMLYVAR